MNEQIIRNVTQVILDKDIPEGTDLWGNIYGHIAKTSKHQPKSFHRAMAWISIGIITILVFVLFLSFTEPGRALAQQIRGLFTRAPGESFQLTSREAELLDAHNNPPDEFFLPLVNLNISENSTLDFSLKGCEDAATYITYDCKIKRAETEAGFDFFEFSSLPSEWELDEVIVTPGLSQASMHFFSGWGEIFFDQGLGDFPESYFSWEIVPEGSVEVVDIGGTSGEYVRGWYFMDRSKMQAVWQVEGSPQRLAWRDGQRWFEISLWAGPAISKEWLINLASSLGETANPTPSSNRIENTEIAEIITGIDLKVPAKLPLGVQFSNAIIDYGSTTVTLIFNGQASLTINESLLPNRELLDLAARDPGAQKVMIGDQTGYLLLQPGEPFVSTPGIGGKTNMFLIWENEGVVFGMDFHKYEIFGGVITKDDMIAIANSMQDGHLTGQSGLQTPYSWLADYEKLMNFDILEVNQPEMQFIGIEGNPREKYAVVVYRDISDRTMLFLYQGTGKSIMDSEWANIPMEFREKVDLGESGELARGINVGGEWKADAPYLRIRWKVNNQWFEMISTTDTNQNLDPERLLNLARSLK